jgi:arylsulfatase
MRIFFTFAAAAGGPDIVAKVAKGYNAGNKTFKVHLDGYNLIPYQGEEKVTAKGFLYWSDDGDPSLCGSPSGKSPLRSRSTRD